MSVKKQITVVFSGNGADPTLAIDKNTYQNIRGELFDRFKDLEINKYVTLKDGERLYNIFENELLDLFPKKNNKLKGYIATITFEPIISDQINKGWFGE